jgi:hypothetical protein
MQADLRGDMQMLSSKLDMAFKAYSAAKSGNQDALEQSGNDNGQDQIVFISSNPGKVQLTPGLNRNCSTPVTTVESTTERFKPHAKLQDPSNVQKQSRAGSGILGLVSWLEDGGMNCCAKKK